MICAVLTFLNLSIHPLNNTDWVTIRMAADKCAKQNECLSYFHKKELSNGHIHYHVLCKKRDK